MKIATRYPCHGIALIIVMVSILAISIIAGAFAYSMKIETKLARNANSETELEWLGRSGVEYARYCLAERLRKQGPDQDPVWPGVLVRAVSGPLPGTEPEPLPNPNQVWELGNGRFHITKITDLESKFNINWCVLPNYRIILDRALLVMGVDVGNQSAIAGSIIDWMDNDSGTHIGGGAEKEYYRGLPTPHEVKDGPIDELSEMLLIKNVADIFSGLAVPDNPGFGVPPIALTNFFTTLGTGRININTASEEALQLLPDVDINLAQAIVAGRVPVSDPNAAGAGLTGPYKSVEELRRLPLMPLPLIARITPYCDVRSYTFEVQVEAEVGGYSRQFIAVIGASNPNDPQVLNFYSQ
jgi:type II secretory pathway component PulK